MKALLLALTCLALLAAACGGNDNGADGGGSADSATSGGASAAPTAPDTPAQQPALNTAVETKLIVTSTIDLQVDSLRDSYDTISRLAHEAGGFVAEARLSDNGDASGSASLRLRVPATRHDDLVASLHSLDGTTVKREDSNAREVTAEYTDLQSRVVNLQRTEAQYQALLSRAGSIDEVLKVTAKLDSVRGDIEQLQGRIRLLDDQSDYATVTVKLSLPPVVAAPVEDKAKGLPSPVRVFVDAMDRSFVVAHALLNVVVVLFVASLWLLPAGVVSILVWRRFRPQLERAVKWLT
jgi:glycine cleavage system regulatory protein